MRILRKTAKAEQDLLDMWAHISADNEPSADKLYEKIEERCRLYADNALMAVARPELYQGLRAFPVRPYMVYYLPIKGGIQLVRVLHGSRDIEMAFEEKL